jgi:gluconolactonase
MFLTERSCLWGRFLIAGCLSLLIAVASDSVVLAQNTTNFPTIGQVEQFDPQLEQLIAKDAVIQVLCGGFEWSEGPVWVPEAGNKFGGYVLFSDIPNNAVMKWQESIGASVFLKPSGYTGAVDYGKEPGSNGLALDCERSSRLLRARRQQNIRTDERWRKDDSG